MAIIPFKRHDRVIVYYADREYHELHGEIQRVPEEGDELWYIKSDHDGLIHAINPRCHDLDSIVRQK